MKIEDRIGSFINEKKAPKDIQKQILSFLVDNPSPEDDIVHAFAEKIGIEVDDFEAYIYDLLGSIIGAGRAVEKGVTEDDVDPKELKMGIEVEYEHTTNPMISKRIALDHLAECKTYYTRLLEMEKECEQDGEEYEE